MTDPGPEATDGDGLIAPEHFVIGADYVRLAADQIEQAGSLLTALSSRVVDPMSEISAAWWRLPQCYEAPEQSQVYVLMNPAQQGADAMAADFGSADVHLAAYAAAVLAEQGNLRDLTDRADAFRAAVVGGVEVPLGESAGSVLADALGVLGVGGPTVTVPWFEDTATCARNAALLEEHAAIAARINAAAVTCANAIDGLVRALPDGHAPAAAYGEEVLADSRTPMPWGYPRDEERNVGESVNHGIYRFLGNAVIAAGALGGWDVLDDWERTPGIARQSWGGLGDALGSLVVAASLKPYRMLAPAGDQALVGALPDDAQAWVRRREEVATGTLAGLGGIDYESHLAGGDGLWMWREDGVATATESVLNVGTMFIGPGGTVRGATGAGLRTLRVATGSLDFVVPGTSFLVHGGIGVVRGLRNAVKTGDLQPVALADDLRVTPERTPPSEVAESISTRDLSDTRLPRTGVADEPGGAPSRPSWVTSDHVAPTPEQQLAFAEAVQLGPQRPELWIDLGNPNRATGSPVWTRNCGACARSFVDAFQGREIFAAYGDGRPVPAESLEMWSALGAQAPPLHVNSGRMSPDDFTADAYARLESSLSREGPGSVAIVGVDWHSGHGGHYFNAYVDAVGDVWWADLQSGDIAPWPPPYLQRIHQIDAAIRGATTDTWKEVSW